MEKTLDKFLISGAKRKRDDSDDKQKGKTTKKVNRRLNTDNRKRRTKSRRNK
jgi:hypothetical protein